MSRGSRVIYGEGIWSTPPTVEAVAPLAGRLDELVSLAEVIASAARQRASYFRGYRGIMGMAYLCLLAV